MAGTKEKSDPETPPITGGGQIFSFFSQISLYLTVFVVFIGQTRIESRDIRIQLTKDHAFLSRDFPII